MDDLRVERFYVPGHLIRLEVPRQISNRKLERWFDQFMALYWTMRGALGHPWRVK